MYQHLANHVPLYDRIRWKLVYRRRIVNHQYFTSMRYYETIEIDKLDIAHGIKRKMVKAFMKIKFKVFREKFLELVNNPENFIDQNKVKEVFLSAIKEYESLALSAGIPQVFIDAFSEWHRPHIELTFDTFGDIFNSQTHRDMFHRMTAVLDILMFAFRMTIIDAEKTINSMNGSLEPLLKGTIFDE